MDGLYWASASIACAALVLISAVIPWGVFTRYVLNRAASWPEPMAILLAIPLTFIGGAACYRASVHMRITVARDQLPPRLKWATSILSELVVGAIAMFMLIWGTSLCQATWNQTNDTLTLLRVGITYLPIPIGGAVTVMFVIERLLIGPPANLGSAHGAGGRVNESE